MIMIERFGHGGDIWTAAESFGLEADRILDYSSNINPFGPPEQLFSILKQALPQVLRYPDPTCRNLRKAVANSLGSHIQPENILVGNGAAECLHLAVSALKPQIVGIICPSFSEYEAIARQADCEIRMLFTKKEEQFLPDVKELCAFVKQVDMLFIGHPNNPTGNFLPRNELQKVAEACEQHKTYLCVDEAFLDFVNQAEKHSLVTDLHKLPHVLLFRSMTKMYAIAGLRLGYVLGQEQVIRRLKSKQISWSVNHLAQVAGEFLIQQHDYVLRTQEYVATQRASLLTSLETLSGITTFRSETNYLLVHVDSTQSQLLQEEMAKRGILIRNCSMYPGLGEGYIRLAIKTKEENERMVSVFRESLQILSTRR
ncbi:threonine-phosphate decarboxylase CobD [Brevibacillus laterosporus]|uniref:threonine-phosphate decarboxylase CobD n=1 Tax=Brevibacillus laterosporus TaxID=1465 RepID=UPI001F09B06F|nr:threonine-phosphate decarboxylase CobD [Brevibacillus laterosporus]